MSDSAFWFVMVLVAGGFMLICIEAAWRKDHRREQAPDESHERLMRELRRHD